MTSSTADWRLERLSKGAREAAEIASLGAGLSLSAWLARLIAETCAREGIERPRVAPADRDFVPEKPRAQAAIAPAPPVVAEAATIAPPPLQAANIDATMLPVAALDPASLGTRQGEDTPDELVTDLATRGVRQPLLVRRAAGTAGRFEIICGHRRWRAAKRIGLARVPVTLCAYDDGQAILASLGENTPLGDLSPIEEAQAYLNLLTRCAVDAGAIAQACGRDRQHIVRAVRLLGLPPLVRQLISGGQLTSEHAYLLLDSPDPAALAAMILGEKLSVEATRQRLSMTAGREARS
jgi:ParB family transcriptional regulator, chromosome partitioning protein